MTALFPIPVGFTKPTINVSAEAVATNNSAACDVTPMFICNPFEKPDGTGKSLQSAFAAGEVYSREFTTLKAAGAPGPGNYGLLDSDIKLDEAFGKGDSDRCYSAKSVTTKTGVTLGLVRPGVNVRFDMYDGGLNSEDKNPDYRPAANVRKGDTEPTKCNKYDVATDGSAVALPHGSAGTYPDMTGVSGDYWDRSYYWSKAHGGALPTIQSTSDPVGTTYAPSRYDVYRYEIANNRVADKSSNGENGVPQCYTGPAVSSTVDRRIIFAAVVNCYADADKIAGKTALRPDAFVSIFLDRPVEDESHGEKPIYFEVVDVTGFSGNGTLDTFVRQESTLVR
jgi:hypothetical protein